MDLASPTAAFDPKPTKITSGVAQAEIFVPIVFCVENASANRLPTPFGAIPEPFPVSRSKANFASVATTGMPGSRRRHGHELRALGGARGDRRRHHDRGSRSAQTRPRGRRRLAGRIRPRPTPSKSDF